MDDTFTIIKNDNRNNFLEHLNSIHPKIKFTSEEIRSDRSVPFLDILITPEEDGSLKTSIYRKPTHTDLYLQWDSHHTFPSKYSVVDTLYHRAKTICLRPQLFQEKEQYLFQALKRCKYPTWALNRVKIRIQNPTKHAKRRNTNQANQMNNNNQNLYMVVPYYQGFSESIIRACKKFGVQVHFKGGHIIKTFFWAQRTKVLFSRKVGSHTHTNVIERGVKRSTLENLQEHLQRSSKNIKRLLPQYLTIVTSEVTMSLLTTSA